MKVEQIITSIIRGILIGILLFLLLGILFVFPLGGAFLSLVFRLVAGPVYFLSRNLPAISVNADVWIPGVLAFLVAVGVTHGLALRSAAKRGRRWPVSATVALSAVLPLLFSIAFLVPGILLQGKMLINAGKLFESKGRGSERAANMVFARNHMQWIAHLMNEKGREKYPDTLLSEEMPSSGHDLIYPAAGMPVPLDGSFPLIISPPYRDAQGVMRRWLFTADYESREIPAEDLDVWLEKSIELRKRMEAGR